MKKRKKKIDNKLVGIIILIILAGALVAMFAKYQYGKDYDDTGDEGLGSGGEIIVNGEDAECGIDSDCGWHYTNYENRPCGSCSFADEEYICINNQEAEDLFVAQMTEKFGSLNNMPVCALCPAYDFELYNCKCVNTQCVKEKV
tara:strand:+ start:796 stop:1227 length:432 start_codon:yes stop_codon:yes gene_type:complete